MQSIRPKLFALAQGREESGARVEVASDSRKTSRGDDDIILRDFFQGSEPKRSRLYKHVLPLCRSTIGRMLGPRHPQAEDLLQSAIEGIVRTLVHGTFSRRCSLKTWAVIITRNIVVNEVRGARRDRRYLVSEDLDTHPERKGLLCAVEEGEVRSAVLRLPTEMAEALVLHDLCGYTTAEIAEEVGLTSAGVQSRVSRARDLARRDLCGERRFRARADHGSRAASSSRT